MYRQASLCTVHITADPMPASVTSICRHVAGHWYNRQQHVRHRDMQRARRRLPLSQGTEPRATLHATHAHSELAILFAPSQWLSLARSSPPPGPALALPPSLATAAPNEAKRVCCAPVSHKEQAQGGRSHEHWSDSKAAPETPCCFRNQRTTPASASETSGASHESSGLGYGPLLRQLFRRNARPLGFHLHACGERGRGRESLRWRTICDMIFFLVCVACWVLRIVCVHVSTHAYTLKHAHTSTTAYQEGETAHHDNK